MPRSFLVKKTTKCKDEKAPSCDADGQVVDREDAVVKDSRSLNCNVPMTTTSVAGLQNIAESIARETKQLHRADTTITGDHRRGLLMSPSLHVLSFAGEYAV